MHANQTFRIRLALPSDLPRLTEIYNHYVIHTPITFDLVPHTVEGRIGWFEQFAPSGRHRLLVAEENSIVVGYAGTTKFRNKAAYETSVETTIYCSHEVLGRRYSPPGRWLHAAQRSYSRASRTLWIQTGRGFQRSGAQIRALLGCGVLGASAAPRDLTRLGETEGRRMRP
jgi:hypothetical protein